MGRRLKNLAGHGGGASAIEFAIVMPIIVLISIGIIEFTLVMFDYHRAAEATRRGARSASYMAAIGGLDNLVDGATVRCTGSNGQGGVSCSDGAVEAAQSFHAILGVMREIMPHIGAHNLIVAYAPSGIGDITTPGGLKPRITVQLTGVRHDFLLFGGFAGLPGHQALPAFQTTVIGLGYRS